MRVVYFAHYAGGTDAASAMDADLFAEMRAQGHDVVVLSPFRIPDVGRIGGSVSAGRLPRFLLSAPGYARMLAAGVRQARVSGTRVASQYHAFHPATLVAFLVARLQGSPLVARAHDPLPGSYRSALEAWANRILFRLYRRILGHPETWVTVPSPELRELAATRLGLPREHIVVVPNNVTPDGPPADYPIERLLGAYGLRGQRIVLQFGSFTSEGTGTFVEALRLLGRADVRGVVLADANRGATYRREAERRGIGDRVLVLGLRPRQEVSAFVALADVCVGILSADPTARGSLPRNTLESMASGRPVVLCEGVVSTTLAEPGVGVLLVPPKDPAALARALARILDDPELAARLGQRAQETIRDRFHSTVVARSFASLIDGVCGPPRS